jgi:hypothetical protein
LRRSSGFSVDTSNAPPQPASNAENIREGWLPFFFYSNEHRPIHVHVRRGGGEAVFEVEHAVELRESQGLKVAELSKAEQLANEHRQLIIQTWNERFNR